MEQLAILFGAYYGLDWISSVLGLIGLYLVGEKRSSGFLFTVISVIMAAIVAISANQYGFLLANLVTCILSVRGYRKWKQEEIVV